MAIKEKIIFFRECLLHPIHTSSFFPSSQRIAQMMSHAGSPESAKVTVEIGPGTGSLTREILKEVPEDSTFFTIEINPQFAKQMQKSFPEVETICADAAELPKILKKKKLEKCDRIVSGIPWASFEDKTQDALLNSVINSLQEDGEFITITFVSGKNLPQGRRFQKKLKHRFNTVITTPIVWSNIPPAIAYYCNGPK